MIQSNNKDYKEYIEKIIKEAEENKNITYYLETNERRIDNELHDIKLK